MSHRKRELTGRKVFAIFAAAFGLIIAVNLVMAWNAIATFPGLEVRNSYVASQGFNARLASQRALGWDVQVEVEEGELRVRITEPDGTPAAVADLSATLGRATHTRDDLTPAFTYAGGSFRAPVALEGGNWNLRLVATDRDGTEFRQRVSFRHRG
jgi:nitrogen fixation protein FixH